VQYIFPPGTYCFGPKQNVFCPRHYIFPLNHHCSPPVQWCAAHKISGLPLEKYKYSFKSCAIEPIALCARGKTYVPRAERWGAEGKTLLPNAGQSHARRKIFVSSPAHYSPGLKTYISEVKRYCAKGKPYVPGVERSSPGFKIFISTPGQHRRRVKSSISGAVTHCTQTGKCGEPRPLSPQQIQGRSQRKNRRGKREVRGEE